MRTCEAVEFERVDSDAPVARVDSDATVARDASQRVVIEPATPPRREPSERLANVERLRIVAMIEIVTFHVGGAVGAGDYRLPLAAGLGLPVFLLLNNAFNTTLSERMGTRAFLDVKVSRLVLPWLVWCAVYSAVVLAEKVRHHEALSEAFSPWMIVGGTYSHLWFVPFALFGSLLIALLQRRTRAVSHRLMAGLTLGIGAVILLVNARLVQSGRFDWPSVQWLFALPSPLLGFALGRVLMARERPLLGKLALLLTILAALTLALTWMVSLPEMTRRYAVSLALVSLFFLWPGPTDALSRRLTPLLFGVYLIHPLLLRAYQGGHLPEVPTPVLGVAVFAVAALLVEGLRRSPLRRLV
jgi:surface polysaccharide O-acyltransferase-like enzyme